MFTGIITNIAQINKLTYIKNKDLNLLIFINSDFTLTIIFLIL